MARCCLIEALLLGELMTSSFSFFLVCPVEHVFFSNYSHVFSLKHTDIDSFQLRCFVASSDLWPLTFHLRNFWKCTTRKAIETFNDPRKPRKRTMKNPRNSRKVAALFKSSLEQTIHEHNSPKFRPKNRPFLAIPLGFQIEDSACNSINGMIKKTQSFLTLMNDVAGPGGLREKLVGRMEKLAVGRGVVGWIGLMKSKR